MSKVEEYKKQLKAIEDLKQTAIAEIEGMIAEAQGHVDRLTAELAELQGTGTRGGMKVSQKPAKRTLDPTKPCSVCGFATTPNHDARTHRQQNPKKAFTAAELKEKGMVKG